MQRGRARRVMGTLGSLALLTATACGTGAGDEAKGLPGPDNTPKGQPIIVGADLDVTGPAAQYNTKVREGIDLAIEVVNRGGGVLGRPLRLVSKNSQSDPAKAPATYNALIDEGAVAVIGYVTAAIPPVKKIVQDAKLLTLATASTSTALVQEKPNDYLYSLLPTAEAYAEVFCSAFEKTGAKNVALFHDDAPGVAILVSEYKKLFRQCLPNGFVTEESAALDSTDFTAPVTRIADANPDAVLTVSVGGSFQSQSESALAQALPETPRYSIGGYDGQPESWKVAQPGALDGLVTVRPFTQEENPRAADIAEKLRSVQGDDAELSQMHVLGYDSVMLIVQALENAKTADDPEKLNTAFQSIQGFKGGLGQPSFTLSFGKDKHVGADGSCGLVLYEFGPDNTLADLWNTHQQPC